MNSVKTAISLPKSLFDEVEQLARDLGVSRSQIFAMAVAALVRQRQKQRLLRELNEAYQDSQSEELEVSRAMRELYRQAVTDEW